MRFIAHRINTIEELHSLPCDFGAEIDIRDFGDRLIIQHDPFIDGVDFELYLQEYQHGTLILNIKSERIEFRVLELIKKYNIQDYFFLDCSFPMIMSLIQTGESRIALRYSEHEGIDTIKNLHNKINWVWVDCFSYLPLNKEVWSVFKDMDLKVCMVSPELQQQTEKLIEYKNQLKGEGIKLDAICSKRHNYNFWCT